MKAIIAENKDKKPKIIWEGVSDRKEVNDMIMKGGQIRSMRQDIVQSIWKSFLTMDAI